MIYLHVPEGKTSKTMAEKKSLHTTGHTYSLIQIQTCLQIDAF